jgi:hypothetical protein
MGIKTAPVSIIFLVLRGGIVERTPSGDALRHAG